MSPTEQHQQLSQALEWAGVASIIENDKDTDGLIHITITREAVELLVDVLITGSKYA
jgi:hypothetical protein